MSIPEPVFHFSLLLHQPFPGASQGLLKSQHGRQQDIYVSSLEFLHRADVQISHFGQFLLRDILARPLATEIGPERLKLRCLFLV